MQDLSNDNIIHVIKENIEYIQFRRLLEYEDVLKHGFILKKSGFNYKEPGNEKFKSICTEFDIESKDIIRCKQTHSANVGIVDIDNKTDFFNETDGLITKEKNVILPIQVADCISLLFFDPQKNVIANVHSGWRGTVQRIAEVSVRKMITDFKCNPCDIICCIGPSIAKCHFEVDKDVKDIFEKEFNDMLDKDIIIKSKTSNEKYFIDTILINRLMLNELGLKDNNIIESNVCTVCNSKDIHSYRVDKEDAGRNLSIITLI